MQIQLNWQSIGFPFQGLRVRASLFAQIYMANLMKFVKMCSQILVLQLSWLHRKDERSESFRCRREHLTYNQGVLGSSPSGTTIFSSIIFLYPLFNHSIITERLSEKCIAHKCRLYRIDEVVFAGLTTIKNNPVFVQVVELADTLLLESRDRNVIGVRISS